MPKEKRTSRKWDKKQMLKKKQTVVTQSSRKEKQKWPASAANHLNLPVPGS